MKLRKKNVSRVASVILAAVMAVSMVPAAFAAATDLEKPGTIYTPIDSTHHLVQTLYENGDYYEDKADCVFQDGNPCVCGNTKPADTDTSWCDHVGKTFSFEALGDGTHNVICTNCGETVSLNVDCFDDNADGLCDACHAAMPACNHMGQHFKFVPNNNGTHNVLCDDCKAVVSENVPCNYVDGKCIQCGATKPEEVGTTYTVIDATHHHVHAVYEGGTVYDADVPCVFETGTCVCGNTCPHSTFKYENNGNGTHKVICAECGAVVTEATECVYGEDGKGTCACGAKYACDHMGNHWTYVNNGNSTHNVVCADCGAVVSANVACNYENGVCITCSAKQSECNHMGNHWTYKDNGNGTHKVICKDCGNVVEKHADCVYTDGKCVCGGHKKTVVIPGTDELDPSFSVSRYPICQFFHAVRQFFRSLFHRV